MKIRSKYLNREFDNGWVCAYVGVANVQGKKKKRPGAMNYYYVFERRTSDDKADKIVKLNSTEAAAVYKGKATVETLADKRAAGKGIVCDRKLSYSFRD